MLLVYPAVFHKEENAYWVEFPDLTGCQSYGSTLVESMENAQEALFGYASVLLDESVILPKASDIATITLGDNCFASLVTCDLNQYKNSKAVKKKLTIPSWLNDRATSLGINFSQTLQDALLHKIQNI